MTTEADEGLERRPWGLQLLVGDVAYALPLERLRAVLENPAVTRLPGAPHGVVGVVNVRGEVVPVVDPSVALGGPRQPVTEFAVVVESRSGPLALLASACPTSLTAEGDDGGAILDADALVPPRP